MKLDAGRDGFKCVAEVATTLTIYDSHDRFDGADGFLDGITEVGIRSLAEEIQRVRNVLANSIEPDRSSRVNSAFNFRDLGCSGDLRQLPGHKPIAGVLACEKMIRGVDKRSVVDLRESSTGDVFCVLQNELQEIIDLGPSKLVVAFEQPVPRCAWVVVPDFVDRSAQNADRDGLYGFVQGARAEVLGVRHD